MPINDRTTARSYAKPNAGNLLSEDVERLREALDSIDTDVAALLLDVLSKAATASPAFTGTPTAPTPETDTDSTQLATTAFVKAQTSTANPAGNGTAAAGVSGRFARADHVHPTDTTRAPLASPTFTGIPTAPTPDAGDNSGKLATTAFVMAEGYVKQTRQLFAGTGLTGGGDLSANRTFAVDIASQAEAEAGTSSGKLMTPQRTAQAISGRTATQTEAEAGTSSSQLMTPERTTQAVNARRATQAEAEAGADNSKLMTPERTAQAIAAQAQRLKVETAKTANNTSGTLEFTGLPSWVKRITLLMDGLSTSTGTFPKVQLGAGSYQVTGYTATSTQGGTNDNSFTDGFGFAQNKGSDEVIGQITFSKITGNTWVGTGITQLNAGDAILHLAGSVTLSGTLDRIRVTANTANFDAGTINIFYEG